MTPPPKRGEATRVNRTYPRITVPICFIFNNLIRYHSPPLKTERLSIPSLAFAKALFDILGPQLPHFAAPFTTITEENPGRPTTAFNSNIRLYKYTEGQYFGCHYDDSVRDPAAPGAHSEWTLLIYLSGSEDGVVGGEVCVI